jgi:FAD dependent oxidoreductase TIGR03364
MEKAAVKVNPDSLECADGSRFNFDHLLVASGDDMRTLFPEKLAESNLSRCRLQMMRTKPQPGPFRLGTIMVSDLTLCHYPAFQNCSKISALRKRVSAELPNHLEKGIHVIAAQHLDGTVTVGDSHEYAPDFEPGLDAKTEELILGYLKTFTRIPHLQIDRRWHGTYLKSTVGYTQVILHPAENVTLVSAMGGLGMTLAWGLAEKTVSEWSL